MKEIVLSVHGLVDFLLRRGSIDNRIYNNASMAEGSRIHLRYQKIQGGTYLSEEPLEISYQIDDYLFKLNGRADGIILDKIPVIDEIKTTVVDLEEFYESLTQSWTWKRLTEEEKKKFNNMNVLDRLKGTNNQRIDSLNLIYHAFLLGLGYDSPNWRD